MTQKLFNLVVLIFCLSSLSLFATCKCGPACSCSCQQGQPCTCPKPCGWPDPEGRKCGPFCTCGCKYGEPCTCPQPNGWENETVEPTSECDCGCDEGNPCTCNNYMQGCINGVCGVPQKNHFNPCRAPAQSDLACGFDVITAKQCGLRGVWLPEDPVLFRNIMADPRQVTYSAGWRFDDQVLVRNVIDVSFGDSIPFYRWFDVGFCNSALQLDLEGAIWVCFDPLHDSSPLMNADYYGGLVLTYAYKDLSFRLRGYHISSHIGDEFLLDHPDFDRRNASAEYLDFFASWDWTSQIRLYGGLGWIIAQDDEFKCNPFYGAAGAEFRIHGFGFTNWCNQIYGEPILGMYFRFSKDYKKHLDSTYIVGYEWGKLCGLARKVRLFLEYHDGYSVEGQFCKLPTNYFSVRISYGY